MNLSRKVHLKIMLLAIGCLLSLNGWAQSAVDSLVYADSVVHIYLSSSDTVVVHNTDTVVVISNISSTTTAAPPVSSNSNKERC